MGEARPVSQDLGEARPVSQDLGEARPVSQDLGEARPVSQDLGEARPVSQDLGEARPVSQELGEARPVSQELGEARPVSQELGEARPATFEAELAEQSPIDAAPASEPVDSGDQAVPDTGDATRTTSMAQMYNTWVELGETISAAQAEMQSLLANRRKSETLRVEAQEVLEQAESAWDEAGRLGDAARKAIERGFTVNLPGFAARLRMVDEIEQARLTQAQLRRSTTNEAWEEADRARQKATTELLKALAEVALAASQAERERRETDKLPAMAETLLNSAVDDLKAARSIGDELAHLGREAFSLLAGNDVSGESSRDKPPTPLPITGQSETQPVETRPATDAAPDQQDAVAPGGGIEAQDLQETQAASETTEGQPEVHRAGGAGNQAPVAVETPPVGAEAAETAPKSAADDLRREFESAGSEGSGTRETAEHTDTDVEAPAPVSAAEELERELSALRSQLSSPEPPGGPQGTPGGSGPAPRAVTGSTTQSLSSDAVSGGLLRRGELDRYSEDRPQAVAPALEPEPSTSVPDSYSGRIYLMFPASLTQDELESVWESLEEVAGSGTISDHRLISRQDGVQFTLELGNKGLVIDRLRKQMPGAGLTPVAEDRLIIDWPRHG